MKSPTKMKRKVNPNEYGGLLYNQQEIKTVKEVLFTQKIFRYSGNYETKSDVFEKLSRRFFKKKFSLGLNNGTSALKAALIAVGVTKGDRVLISAYTFIATAEAVISIGAIPIPIEFNYETCLDIEDLNSELKKGAKAIIAVHLQGRAFNLNPILKIAQINNISLIEDACQSFGARYKSIYAGCFGDIGVFSFQQNKLLTCGEGGMLVTNNENFYKIARNYSDHGVVRSTKLSWDSEEALVGDNLRINNLQSALLIEQLNRFQILKSTLKKNRDYLLKKFNKIKIKSIVKSSDPKGDTNMNILFMTQSPEKAEKAIEIAKIDSVELRYLWHKPYYTFKVIINSNLDSYTLKGKNCVNAENYANCLISMSLPPILTKKDLDILFMLIVNLKNSNIIE